MRQILPLPYLAQVPGQPAVVAGYCNLRGAAVPVIRLDRLFQGEAEAPGLYAHLLLLENAPTASHC